MPKYNAKVYLGSVRQNSYNVDHNGIIMNWNNFEGIVYTSTMQIQAIMHAF
jgi:hypothetical protein